MNAGMAKLLARDGEGERLDRFELVAELASGGMATVYLARLLGVAGFQRLVAIKRLHPHLAKEPDFIQMFLDEARLAARIHHPNVVSIQEVGQSAQGYYLVMDYVEGDTFARLLSRAAQAKTQIPWGVTIRILLDTLAGLHAAHELTDDLGQPLALVHRDVSPQNILIGADGIARITDFGVARAASRLSTTRSGQLKGKLAYMAPEQARGEEIDRRADIFSCGIVLWEALALKRLFKGNGEAATLNLVLHEPIAPPSKYQPDIPSALEAVCMKALERDVDKRWATAAKFADELERVARSLSCIGSVRDVAACLESVFGDDLTQQREAVRAWLARSEPSRPRRIQDPRPVETESVKTRVEGKSEPSRPRSGELPPFVEPALAPVVVAPAVTAANPVAAASPVPVAPALTAVPPTVGVGPSQAPENVSSVPSAVLPPHDAMVARDGSGRARSGLRMAAAVLVTGVVLGVGAWVAVTRLHPQPAPAPGAGAGAGSPPSAASSAETPTSAQPVADAPVASASTSASTSTSTSRVPTTKVTKKPSTTKPTAAPAIPDDLSKNPYR
jgi:serine/threonine-protein kinase